MTMSKKIATRITFTTKIDGEECVRYIVLDMAEDEDLWTAIESHDTQCGDGLYDAIGDDAILDVEPEDEPHAYNCIPW